MGGTTLVQNGKTVEAVLKKIKEEIIKAFPNFSPDSDVVLFNPTTKEGKIFKATTKWAKSQDEIEYPEDVEFKEVEQGNIAMPATVASIYGKKPRKGEWQGSVHLHT